MMKLDKAQEVVLAILSELEESGIAALTLTSLVKFVYLVDYSHAKETGGETLTVSKWHFLHFGPFDSGLMKGIDVLEVQHLIERKSGGGTTKDYQLYSLGKSVARRSLESIGLPAHGAARVRQYLQEFARDQSKLLNFVYFKTEPMEAATPGALLDFTDCRADKWQDVKPLKAQPIPPAALQAYKDRLAERRADEAAKRRQPIVWEGPFDDVYQRAMALLDSQGPGDKIDGGAGILAL